MSNSSDNILYTWLGKLKIPVSKNYLRQQLLSHPDYPSLLSITDTLNEMGIENAALQIEKDQLQHLPIPFMAHLNGNNGAEFAIINNRDSPENQFPKFFDRWSGIAVAAEKSDNWQHKQNVEWLQKDKKQFLVTTVTLLLLTGFIFLAGFVSISWLQTSLLLLAVAGIFVSWMIVSQDLGIENKIADQVCGKTADCNSVIHSKETKLPLGIGWSDAGIIYFSFLLLTLLVSSFTESSNGIYILLSVFAAGALLVTLLSVYYQWRVVKKWCRLCLITVGLLWVQFIILMPFNLGLLKGDFDGLSWTNAALPLFFLFITSSAWFWLKPLLKENKQLEKENFKATRFKRNTEVFKALLEKQRKLTVNPDGLGIMIGNPAAANTIIKVCNPYCGPCSKAHVVIEELLKSNSDLKVQIIFTATDDEKDNTAKPVKHLMALYEKNDMQLMQKALDDWYLADKKEYDVFSAKYLLNGELEKQGESLTAMKAWCDEVKIEFTPTVFVNGYQLPRQYHIEDVKYFLEK